MWRVKRKPRRVAEARLRGDEDLTPVRVKRILTLSIVVTVVNSRVMALWESGQLAVQGRRPAFPQEGAALLLVQILRNYCTYYCPAVEPFDISGLQLISGAESRNNGGGDT